MKIYIYDTVKQEVVETIEGDAEKAMEVAEGYCEKGEKVIKTRFKTKTDYTVMYLLVGVKHENLGHS